MLIPLLLAIIFAILGFIHLNWARGGTWGFDAAIPTNEAGEKVMNPKKLDSAVVGFGLLFFGTFYLILGGVIQMDLPIWVMNSVRWVIPSIFLLRAMGDFKYVGFFKKVKDTKFGQKDSQIFSPLCLVIGLLGVAQNFL